jgi:hypothetical protein
MKFDFSAADLFLDFVSGGVKINAVLDHPAYQAVLHHADLFSSGIVADDIERALRGERTAFYGLDKFFDRNDRIIGLLKTIRKNSNSWSTALNNQLSQLFPGTDLNITIYPIIGYDMGIGLDGVVCMNVNTLSYLNEPYEFLFYAIHEATHVVFERSHSIMPLEDVVTRDQWRSYFNLWMQNEGYAVYAPYKLRQELGFLADHDYKVLSDPASVEEFRQVYLHTEKLFLSDTPAEKDQYLECCFGNKRITYRMGCELIRRIESTYGKPAVIQAFLLDSDEYMDRYGYLLKL